MPVRTTSKDRRGFGSNKVLDSHSLEFLSTRRTGGGSNPTPPSGQIVFSTAGTFSWTAPEGVFSVSVVCVGGGGAGGAAYYAGAGGGGDAAK